MTREPCLNLEHVAVGYGRRIVLPDVNLALARGSFTGSIPSAAHCPGNSVARSQSP